MTPLEDEDEGLSLALAAFHGEDADGLLESLREDRAVRCRSRLHELAAGSAEQRRARLAATFRERFARRDRLLAASADDLVDRLAGERPALIALALADLPASRAAVIAARLGIAPVPPTAPDVAVRTWVRKRLWGDVL